MQVPLSDSGSTNAKAVVEWMESTVVVNLANPPFQVTGPEWYVANRNRQQPRKRNTTVNWDASSRQVQLCRRQFHTVDRTMGPTGRLKAEEVDSQRTTGRKMVSR
jgi:hypothetical protein